jgi:hypothetical protein
LGEELLIVSDQYSKFEAAKDRLDILCVDREAHPVVVELKRTPHADYADLQSLRYAALIRTLDINDAAEALSRFRQKNGKDLSEADAKNEILEFIEPDEEGIPRIQLQNEPRIIIASGEFSRELLTTVDYLKYHEIDVTCISLTPYPVGGDHFILVPDRVYPLRAIEDVTTRIRRKDKARESSHREPVDLSVWEGRTSKEIMHLVDELYSSLRALVPDSELYYTRSYVKLKIGGKPSWLVVFRPQEDFVEVEALAAAPDKSMNRLRQAGFDHVRAFHHDRIKFRVTPSSFERNRPLLEELFKDACEANKVS